jgi:hypothetical protein
MDVIIRQSFTIQAIQILYHLILRSNIGPRTTSVRVRIESSQIRDRWSRCSRGASRRRECNTEK